MAHWRKCPDSAQTMYGRVHVDRDETMWQGLIGFIYNDFKFAISGLGPLGDDRTTPHHTTPHHPLK